MTNNQLQITGSRHQDERGIITYNNDFDASQIKRIYTIENTSTEFIRGWQGHKVEQRWFASMKGSFEISVIKVDDFENPSKDLTIQKYLLTEEVLTYLHVPSGYITAIQSKEKGSKLLVLADYGLGEISDEYRYSLDYFNNI
ncbi:MULTISPECIES: WxcM-like domain-containing protein [Chryseobacterium]|uniref:WxcM-like, C-terminal n=1 Tax=Chryseobacterium taihuense TaxID=1141221 RepID=A0A4U8WAF9_9FLAO|nr:MULTISPECIES: WxcM-like domain-containing protein [Chryseobacterium]QQV03384.1 WxcM-like domain-containing protein [Chryseobacterium sp. FDAARGOS 1104]VFB03301.1 WxcM-like, C-terminal [Chryseobacterium taihuense]